MSVDSLTPTARFTREERDAGVAFLLLLAFIVVAPFAAYPFFVMQMLCIALFACAFNLLIGYVGLLSFGHAMFLGLATPHKMASSGSSPQTFAACALT